jgi:outer membrane protein TolC
LNYKLLELSNQVNEKTLSLKRQAHLPALNLTYQYSNMLKGGFMNFDHIGVATVSIPIFSGLSRNAQVKQAKIEIERGKTNMALLQDNLNISDEQCRFELNSAIESYLLQLENLEVAKRVLENYKNKYNNGVMSSLDLTQANTNYLQAETSFATACLDLLMAHTKLSKLYNNFEF